MKGRTNVETSIQKYRAFLKAVACGSFTRAAEELSYSQSGISRMIHDLERDWEVVLLERGRGGVQLTSDGMKLLPHAQRVCAEYDALQMQVDALHGLQSGLIRIGAFSSVAMHWLPNVIRAFRQDYPNMDYELLSGVHTEVEDWVRTGRVDCGFLSSPVSSELETITLDTDPLYAVLPEGHPLGENIYVRVERLAEEPFILLDEGRGGAILQELVASHPELNVQYRVADDYSILNMVENRLGVAVLPEMVLRNTNCRVLARQLQPPLRRTLGVIYRKRAGLSTAARAFLRELKAEINAADA